MHVTSSHTRSVLPHLPCTGEDWHRPQYTRTACVTRLVAWCDEYHNLRPTVLGPIKQGAGGASSRDVRGDNFRADVEPCFRESLQLCPHYAEAAGMLAKVETELLSANGGSLLDRGAGAAGGAAAAAAAVEEGSAVRRVV